MAVPFCSCSNVNSTLPPPNTMAKISHPVAAEDFNFDGKPIHPGCIWEFNVWLSEKEGSPRVKTIDLKSAIRSYKNFEPAEVTSTGFLMAKDGEEWFAYKHLGVTSTGTHVLRTGYCSGGSGIFQKIFLIRRDKEDYFEFSEDQAKPTILHRHVLKCIGQIGLGDRDDGLVELKGDTLSLGKSRYRDKVEYYHLP